MEDPTIRKTGKRRSGLRLVLRVARKLAISCLVLVGGFTALGWLFAWLDWPIRHQTLPSAADRMVLYPPEESGPEWTRRLRGRFKHSSLSEMIAALQAEGFSIGPERRAAFREYGEFPCGYTFTVSWDATADDSLRGLRGSVSGRCL